MLEMNISTDVSISLATCVSLSSHKNTRNTERIFMKLSGSFIEFCRHIQLLLKLDKNNESLCTKIGGYFENNSLIAYIFIVEKIFRYQDAVQENGTNILNPSTLSSGFVLYLLTFHV